MWVCDAIGTAGCSERKGSVFSEKPKKYLAFLGMA